VIINYWVILGWWNGAYLTWVTLKVNIFVLFVQCYRRRTSPLMKHIQILHSKEKGDHKREMVNGVWRNVCVHGPEKCKVTK
jgi:hypothetical protein